MDDEEYSYNVLQEPSYRVETGNYEYRLILRCRQEARTRFARLRSDVLVKLELLDNKHVQDIVLQLHRLVSGLADFHGNTLTILKDNKLFPVEVDLSRNAFQYESMQTSSSMDDTDDPMLVGEAEEAVEKSNEINESALIPDLN